MVGKRPHRTAAPLIAATGALVACASSGAAPSPAASAILDGTVTTGDPAVVAIVGRRTRRDAPRTGLICSGTLIAPRVVLAAAHCLDVLGARAGAYEVVFGNAIDDPEATRIAVDLTWRDPSYDPETHEHDLALLRLVRPAAWTPIPLADPPSLGESDRGLVVRAVGFGRTADRTERPGVKRTGTMRIDTISGTSFRTLPAPSMTCTGDSGGPVLAMRGDREVLIGVTASGDFACREHAFNVRIDPVRSEVDAFIAHSTDPPPERMLALGALCEATCASDGECPAALGCLEGPTGGQCLLFGLAPGRFGAMCTTDADCSPGSTCARLEDGPEGCRCHTPCVPIDMPDTGSSDAGPARGSAGGCRAGPGPGPRPVLALFVVLRRSAARPTVGSRTCHRAPASPQVSARRRVCGANHNVAVFRSADDPQVSARRRVCGAWWTTRAPRPTGPCERVGVPVALRSLGSRGPSKLASPCARPPVAGSRSAKLTAIVGAPAHGPPRRGPEPPRKAPESRPPWLVS